MTDGQSEVQRDIDEAAKHPGVHIDCTAEEYHRRPEVSQSQIKVFRQSPGRYHGQYIAQNIPGKSSSSMDLGTVVHAAILDPMGLVGVVAEIPRSALNSQGHRKGKAWSGWSEENSTKIQMTQSELQPVRTMLATLATEPRAVELLYGPGRNEQAIVWPDAETGLGRRALLDRMTWSDGVRIVTDVKTCRDMERFPRDAENYGYCNQAAWYLDAAKAIGEDAVKFRLVVGCTAPPYEWAVFRYRPEDIEDARDENRELLIELADRRNRDDWRPRHHGQVRTLERPAHAKRAVKLTLGGKEIVL